MLMKRFDFAIPVHTVDLNNGSPLLVADLRVFAVGSITADGTDVVVDIDCIVWKAQDVTEYTELCCPDKWDEIKAAAVNNFKSLNNMQ